MKPMYVTITLVVLSTIAVSGCLEPDAERCELPADPGPCEAYMPSWYHNTDTGQCEEFIYGGCQGNDNNFATREECQRACANYSNNDSAI